MKDNRFRIRLIIGILILFSISSFSQNTFTSRKGTKFFPGHQDMVITVCDSTVRYELFNHWYVMSYAELRQLTISKDSLDFYGNSNDSLQIKLSEKSVKLIDKRYKLNRKVKRTRLCVSPETMRKISFAYSQSIKYDNIGPHGLYEDKDLDLSKEEFKKKVIKNMDEIITTR